VSKELWYFYADWCPYCQKQKPIMEEYTKSNPDVEVIWLNEASEKDAVELNGISGYPTFIPFKNGVPLERVNGVQEKVKLEAIFA
jgi:thioredoxin 1